MASCPVTLIAGITSPAYGPMGLLTCTTNPILQANLVDFTTSPYVHAPCAWDSLPSITGRQVNVAQLMRTWLRLSTWIKWFSSAMFFCIVGLLDRDAMVRGLAMQVNLLADTGANICLGKDKSLFVDMHDIDPLCWGCIISSMVRYSRYLDPS
jgi:hypothetical protein